MITIWELHFAAPGSPDVLVDLGDLKRQFTDMRIDWSEDRGRLSVMVTDIEVLVQVLRKLQWCVLQSISCSFDKDQKIGGRVVLDDDEEEHSVVGISSFPTHMKEG